MDIFLASAKAAALNIDYVWLWPKAFALLDAVGIHYAREGRRDSAG